MPLLDSDGTIVITEPTTLNTVIITNTEFFGENSYIRSEVNSTANIDYTPNGAATIRMNSTVLPKYQFTLNLVLGSTKLFELVKIVKRQQQRYQENNNRMTAELELTDRRKVLCQLDVAQRVFDTVVVTEVPTIPCGYAKFNVIINEFTYVRFTKDKWTANMVAIESDTGIQRFAGSLPS